MWKSLIPGIHVDSDIEEDYDNKDDNKNDDNKHDDDDNELEFHDSLDEIDDKGI